VKKYLVIYGTPSRFTGGYSNLTYKTTEAPDSATKASVEAALEKTDDGHYTELVAVVDLNELPVVSLEETMALKVATND
jgi:hypothetical protein